MDTIRFFFLVSADVSSAPSVMGSCIASLLLCCFRKLMGECKLSQCKPACNHSMGLMCKHMLHSCVKINLQ